MDPVPRVSRAVVLLLACCLPLAGSGCAVAPQVVDNQPVFELEGYEGQPMVLQGVKRLAVRANNGAPTVVQQELHPGARALLGVLQTATPLLAGAVQILALGEVLGRVQAHQTTNVTGTASGAQSGVVVNLGSSGTGSIAPVDNHSVTTPAPVVVPPVVVPPVIVPPAGP